MCPSNTSTNAQIAGPWHSLEGMEQGLPDENTLKKHTVLWCPQYFNYCHVKVYLCLLRRDQFLVEDSELLISDPFGCILGQGCSNLIQLINDNQERWSCSTDTDSCLLAMMEFSLCFLPATCLNGTFASTIPPSIWRQRIRETPGKGATEWTWSKPQKPIVAKSCEVLMHRRVPPSKLWNSFAIPNAGVKFSWIMVGTPSNKYRHHYMWFDDHMKKTLVIDLDYLSVSFGGDWIGFSKQNLYWPLPHDSSSTHDSAAQVAKAIALAFGKAGHWHFTILESIRVHESIEALYVYIYIYMREYMCV